MKPNLLTHETGLNQFRFPKTVIAKFVTKQSIKGAIAWAIVFSIFMASKAIGFVDSFPTLIARQKIAESFSNNIGIELLLGKAPVDASTGAYVAWNVLGVMVVIGGIWALITAAKHFRGEEDSSRSEILLSGQTTARGAAVENLLGLSASIAVFFVIISAAFELIGRTKGLDFTLSSSLFMALSTTLGILMFMFLGALLSQLMPTRTRVVAVGSSIIGISFLLRVIGDITSYHFVGNLSPLGWVENLKPLSLSHPIWLVPILAWCLIMIVSTVYFAGRRDLGASLFADNDSARPKLLLLGSPLRAAIRLSRASNLGWLVTISMASLLFGLMTKSASESFSQSASAVKLLARLVHYNQQSIILTFVSMVLLILMTIIMVYVASGLVAIRREESSGLVENYLVRPYGRLSWLAGRVFLIALVVILAGGLSLLGLWAGMAALHTAISFHILLTASLNALVPAAFTLGLGIFGFGFWPRLTSFFGYGVVGWSFLLSIVSSGVHIDHLILDTSLLNQIALAPAVNPNWHTDLLLLLISLILGLMGLIAFNRRDLQSE